MVSLWINSVENSVNYNGVNYAQARNIPDDKKDEWVNEDNQVTILLMNNKFYFIDQYVVEGTNKIENNQLIVTMISR